MLRRAALAATFLAAAASAQEPVVQISAKRFEFTPATVELKVGVQVVLELVAVDRRHGFTAPDLGIDAQVEPGTPVRIRVVPSKAGTFEFHCSVFCGSGHEEMTGQIVVKP
jgi:cytochrome c oxidase subunit 2